MRVYAGARIANKPHLKEMKGCSNEAMLQKTSPWHVPASGRCLQPKGHLGFMVRNVNWAGFCLQLFSAEAAQHDSGFEFARFNFDKNTDPEEAGLRIVDFFGG